jgi:protein SCO1
MKGLALAAAASLIAGHAALAHDAAHHQMQMEASGRPTALSLANLDSRWTTQDGEDLTLASLAGQPTVLAMGYTSCKDICPAIVADMMWIEKHLPAEGAGKVRFAFFSIDPAGDTPQRLKAYADDHGFGASWRLYHGDEDSVRELAAALGMGFRPDGQGGFDHAALVTLLDSKGEIVFQQSGARASSGDLLAKLALLIAVAN